LRCRLRPAINPASPVRAPFLERHSPLTLALVGGLFAVVASLLIVHLTMWATGTEPENWLLIHLTTILCPALIAPPMIYWHGAAIQEVARQRREMEALNDRLTKAMAEVRELTGLLPVCAWCHKLRDDQGYWSRVDAFLERHTRAEITHGVCPDCMKRAISEFKCERPTP
jgi:hypothetical protein